MIRLIANIGIVAALVLGCASAYSASWSVCNDPGIPAAAKACAPDAAMYYGLDPLLLRAVMQQEHGPGDRYVFDKNGTKDIGAMQLNSGSIGDLARLGITDKKLLTYQCLNVYIGSWFIKREIVRANGDVWRGIGNYHSHTPGERYKYQVAVWKRLQELRACE